ncbi:MAG TPA: glucose 1-dehydrogenase [Ramlibacter sp.]|uniref:glucose 1-dehydrogenase n=1 Tax=Ramlibacter sp. TaxID=1917967 RepID=UPI002CF398A9|nr:glucose 1-dehydrogenase [Ramlibacter sp.]HVZ44876.1 glucose 1-dehydrogenase [Ramlibacter sp.]
MTVSREGRLQGHVSVITGASSGIGRAVALRFAREGARTLLVDTDRAGLDEVAREIGRVDAEARTVCASVDDEAAATAAVGDTVGRWGRIDSLVAVAGISVGGQALQTSVADWDKVFSVNVKGTFVWCKAVLSPMCEQGAGSIITVASQLALAGGRNNASYVASKGAILSLARSIALDYAERGVRANALVPAAIDTPMLQRSFKRAPDPAAAEQRAKARHPVGRFGTPQEVAAAALFLASGESSFTTGGTLAVDGGWLAA